MSEPVDWNDDTIDYLKVQIEVPREYASCSQCVSGECKSCETLKERNLNPELANRLYRPRMPFPF